MKTLHFKNKEGYRKWLAYGHSRTKTGLKVTPQRKSVFKSTPGHSKVWIGGKRHAVMHKRGQMGIIVGLLIGFMVVTMLMALIPAFVDMLDIGQNSEGLNCNGYVYEGNPLHYLSYNQTLGTKSTMGCLALKLYIPYLVLAILIGVVMKILYDRNTSPAPSY